MLAYTIVFVKLGKICKIGKYCYLMTKLYNLCKIFIIAQGICSLNVCFHFNFETLNFSNVIPLLYYMSWFFFFQNSYLHPVLQV